MSYFEELSLEMDRYLEDHASEEPPILKKIRKETYQKTTQPHMISGHLQGRFLSLVSQLVQPRRILELGTFTGYATLCLAEGLTKDGKIITLDVNEELAYIPRQLFKESAYAHQIEFRLQNAKEYLKATEEIFDFVFIDADKENYIEYWEYVKPKLRSGSVVLFDNVLWYGKVLEEHPKLKSTQIIQQLNEIIAKDSDFENVILPLRDGLHLIRKK